MQTVKLYINKYIVPHIWVRNDRDICIESLTGTSIALVCMGSHPGRVVYSCSQQDGDVVEEK